MEVGVEVWIRDLQGDQSWIPSIISGKENLPDGQMIITALNEFGEEVKFSFKDDNEEIDDLKLKNSSADSEVENLISLPYLHEPAILYCLEQRYSQSLIYTYTGPILIAMNPFKKVPLYTNQILEVYYNSGLLKSQGIEGGTNLPPHVYAIADAAYREMMKALMSSFSGAPAATAGRPTRGITVVPTNHSILISGESGAGKTESTKIVLRYLTMVGNSSGGLTTPEGSVMDKVLQSNPILEAFGNARTNRNDNSSRFGKFIELNFNKRGHLVGGSIRTYLLEKVRLPLQQEGERNFHVFYQIVAGSTAEEKGRWKLKAVEDFRYTSQGGIFVLPHMDDVEEFEALKHGMTVLNFDPSDQEKLLDIVAAVLQMGELDFDVIHDGEGEGSTLSESADTQNSMNTIAELWGLPAEDITRTLTVRTIVARSESYTKKLTRLQASDARDALAKAVYGRLFDWIVRTINRSIEVEKKQIRASIGVLDIFGFECFVHNSFEQLCINYTNETLQQQFNQFIFKMEQLEYEREKIEWSFIEFPDNQDCLDLIEHKLNGIFAMIDDECRLPKATDEKLAQRMYKFFEKHARFSATPAQRRENRFCVKHYAGNVVYSTITFVEKNKDELPKEASTLLQASSVPLLSSLFTAFGPATTSNQAAKTGSSSGASSSAVVSVGAQFKGQLTNLMDSIYATMPHYIRCLKPNDENVPDNFNRLRITEQLRYGGVLEAVRVARSGFPVRLSHPEFYARYRSLANPFSPQTSQIPMFLKKDIAPAKVKEYLDLMLVALWDENIPESQANQNPNSSSRPKLTRRQSRIDDMMLWQAKSSIAKESIQMGLTKVFLRKPAHDMLESRRSRRLNSAARRLQSCYRRHQVHSWFMMVITAQRLIQRVSRGCLARKKARSIRRNKNAKLIQTQVRRFLQESKFLQFRLALVILQSHFRRRRATRFFIELRRNVQAIRLQRLLRGTFARGRFVRFRVALIVLQNRLRKVRAKKLFKEMKVAAKDVGRLQQNNDALKSEIEALKARAAEERQRIQVETERRIQEMAAAAKTEEIQDLRAELENALKLLDEERQLHQETKGTLVLAEGKLEDRERELDYTKQTLVNTEEALSAMEMKLLTAEKSLASAESRVQLLESTAPENPRPTRRPSGTSSGTPFKHTGSMQNLEETQTPINNKPVQRRPSGISSRSSNTLLANQNSFTGEGGEDSLIPENLVSMDEHRQALEKLDKEVQAKAILEEEVSRLRHISMDYKNQIDSLRKSQPTGSSTIPPAPLRTPKSPQVSKSPPTIPGIQPTSAGSAVAASTAAPGSARRRLSASHGKGTPLMKGMRKGSMRGAAASAAAINQGGQESHYVEATAAKPVDPRTPERRSSVEDLKSSTASWSKAWDDEDDSSNNSDNTTATPVFHSNSNPLNVPSAAAASHTHMPNTAAEATAAVNAFERNIELFRNKLKTGVKAHFWEGQKISNTEILLKLDASNRLLLFEPMANRARVALFFQSRIDIAPIGLVEMGECLPGAEVSAQAAEQALLLTIVAKSDSIRGSRILALRFGSKDLRNSILTGLRTLCAELSMNTSSPAKGVMGMGQPTWAAEPSPTAARRDSGGAGSLLAAAAGPSPTAAGAARVGTAGVNPMATSRSTRRLSVRETVLEEKLSSGSKDSIEPSRGLSRQSSDNAMLNAANAAQLEEMKTLLRKEKEKADRVHMQMMVLSNDLSERDEQIALLKRKEEHYEKTLEERDKMFQQDAMVRMQLGKRLEQVLMDKEDALEQLATIKDEIDRIKATFGDKV